MPHLLIAGRTGTGKSVCLNAMILSILMTKRPDEVKLILIDPKMVELSQFKRIPHLMHPVVTDMKKAESLLAWACDKMDERYGFLARAGVRNIQTYNQLGADEIYDRLRPEDDEERKRIPTYMPYIVIIADEMADLMMTAAKEVESHIVRLAQKARAVGMHLILATQKPTVDVITGLIKGNLPARIAFQVASRSDSRVVLDEMGADKLLGNGDMLFLIPGTSHIVRAQGTYVSDAEVNRVCEYLEQYPVEFSRELVQLQVSGGPGGKDRGAALKERDELYEPAIEIIIREGRGSCSLLQRALGHRLRPRRPADRLHGRGRHRRRVQERLRPRGPLHLGGVGGAQERRRRRRVVRRLTADSRITTRTASSSSPIRWSSASAVHALAVPAEVVDRDVVDREAVEVAGPVAFEQASSAGPGSRRRGRRRRSSCRRDCSASRWKTGTTRRRISAYDSPPSWVWSRSPAIQRPLASA